MHEQHTETKHNETKTTPPFTNDWWDLAHDFLTITNKRNARNGREESKKERSTRAIKTTHTRRDVRHEHGEEQRFERW